MHGVCFFAFGARELRFKTADCTHTCNDARMKHRPLCLRKCFGRFDSVCARHPSVVHIRTYANGTWTLSQKHERMIKTAQRKMLRFIVQTKRKYKPKKDAADKKGEEIDKHAEEENK